MTYASGDHSGESAGMLRSKSAVHPKMFHWPVNGSMCFRRVICIALKNAHSMLVCNSYSSSSSSSSSIIMGDFNHGKY